MITCKFYRCSQRLSGPMPKVCRRTQRPERSSPAALYIMCTGKKGEHKLFDLSFIKICLCSRCDTGNVPLQQQYLLHENA